MSITFTPCVTDGNDCHLACTTDHHYCDGTCDDPTEFECDQWCPCVDAHRTACPTCSVEVNMSQTNAAAVIERLGVTFDYCGTIDPDELIGRALTGNVGRDDTGVNHTHTGNMIDCGVRPGYYNDRLGQLADLATYAKDNGFQISWG